MSMPGITPAIGEPYPRDEMGSIMRAMDRMSASLENQRQVIRSSTAASNGRPISMR